MGPDGGLLFSQQELRIFQFIALQILAVGISSLCFLIRNRLLASQDFESHSGATVPPLTRLDVVFLRDGAKAAIKSAVKGLVWCKHCAIIEKQESDGRTAKYLTRTNYEKTREELQKRAEEREKFHFVEKAVVAWLALPARGYALIKDRRLISKIVRYYEDTYRDARARIFLELGPRVLTWVLPATGWAIGALPAILLFMYLLFQVELLSGTREWGLFSIFSGGLFLGVFLLSCWIICSEYFEEGKLPLTERGRILINQSFGRSKAAADESRANRSSIGDVILDGMALDADDREPEASDAGVFAEGSWDESLFDGFFDAPAPEYTGGDYYGC